MPVRRIPKSGRCLTGRLYLAQASKGIGFESWLEKQFYIGVHTFPQVKSIEDQPRKIIGVSDDGVEHIYHPDSLVEFHGANPAPVLVEVKYLWELEEKWGEFQPRMEVGLAYARMNGLTFKIITDAEILPRSNRARNRAFLRRFQEVSVPEWAWKHSEENAVGAGITAHELADGMNRARGGGGSCLQWIWAMVANGVLRVDEGAFLSMKSEVRWGGLDRSSYAPEFDELWLALSSPWEVRP